MPDVSIVSVGTSMSAAKSINDVMTSLSISHTMDMASSIQFTVVDKDFKMLRANYFQLRREVYFRNEIFEISSFDVSSGESGDPQIAVECMPRAIQKMKRDKKPRNYGSTSSYDYVKKIADKFNLYFVGQKTAKTQSIPQAKNEKTDESVWDVIKRLGDEAEFVCFVASIPYEPTTKKEGILFFISQKKLMRIWGPTKKKGKVRVNGKIKEQDMYYLPLKFPPSIYENNFVPLELPSFRKSDNDWREAEGSAILWNDPRGNAQMIRPGMTVRVSDYAPDFNNYYIITAVEWSEDEPGPVKIAFRTPEIPKKKSNATSGSSSSLGSDGTSSDGTSSEDGTETIEQTERMKNLDYLTDYLGQEAGKFLVKQSDQYLQDYVARVEAAKTIADALSGTWVDE